MKSYVDALVVERGLHDEDHGPDYLRYERCKAEWRKANPGATSIQYEQAMAAIVEECGV